MAWQRAPRLQQALQSGHLSGDGAFTGCGEKSVLHSIAALTEAYMRPLYHAKADRLAAAADRPTTMVWPWLAALAAAALAAGLARWRRRNAAA